MGQVARSATIRSWTVAKEWRFSGGIKSLSSLVMALFIRPYRTQVSLENGGPHQTEDAVVRDGCDFNQLQLGLSAQRQLDEVCFRVERDGLGEVEHFG